MADEQANTQGELAALEGARRELESLTYTIAHDLRAPLRAVEGFARALSEDCGERLDEDGRRYVQHVLDAAQRMSAMLEGLLSLARISRAQLQPVSLELSVIARRVLERVRAAEPARTIDLSIPDGITADADPTLLTATLEALLENAWKFTRGREPARIEIGRQPGAPPVYFVRDNGIGFDMRHAGKLFAPFQRLCSEKDFEGTGIGLAAARSIVQRHGGRIWTEAAPDRGATFYFTLSGEP